LGAQYGGHIHRINSNILTFDPILGTTTFLEFCLAGTAFTDNWTLSPSTLRLTSASPPDYAAGCLANSWQFSSTDINTFIIT